MREPFFSPVGAGLVPEETAGIQSANALAAPQPSASGPPPSLYSQPRIAHVGDIVTVIISINDKATLGNASRPLADDQGRRRDRLWLQQRIVVVLVQPAGQDLGDLSSSVVDPGAGQHRPSEQIQVSVAAVVTRVLAERQSRHLGIAGSAGQLRAAPAHGRRHRQPADISLNNTIAYDQIAEARISYGGRGRQSDFSSRLGAAGL